MPGESSYVKTLIILIFILGLVTLLVFHAPIFAHLTLMDRDCLEDPIEFLKTFITSVNTTNTINLTSCISKPSVVRISFIRL